MTNLALKQEIIKVLQTTQDPELGVNIWDLGLIYNIDLQEFDQKYQVTILMTFTSPTCPAIDILPKEVIEKVNNISLVADCKIEVTWTPAWDKSLVSEDILLDLGLF